MENGQENREAPWTGIDIIEIAVRVLVITDLSVDIRSSVKAIVYDALRKTVCLKDEEYSAATLAHEVFHHKQKLTGKLPDGEVLDEYAAFRRKMQSLPNPNFYWTYLTYQWEAEATVFGRVFEERYYRYVHRLGVFSDQELNTVLEAASESTKVKGYLPKHRKTAMHLQEQLDTAYSKYVEHYSKKIDKEIAAVLGELADKRKYSFEILRD